MAEKAKVADEEQPPKKKGKLLVLVMGVVLLLGGGGAYMMGLLGGGKAEQAEQSVEEADAHDEEAHAAARDPEAKPSFVTLPDVLVNLQSTSKRPRFLKLRVALEVMGEETTNLVTELTPRVMDSFQLYLRALSPDDVEGARGLQKLKEEMLARINFAIEPHRVENVLIKEMLVQ